MFEDESAVACVFSSDAIMLLMGLTVQSPGLEQYAMRAFVNALDSIPMALAENSGLSPIETLASIKSRQGKEKNSRLGVDCMQTGSNGRPIIRVARLYLSPNANKIQFTDMREHFVIDPLIGKRQQLLLATQLCRMVLKVCQITVNISLTLSALPRRRGCAGIEATLPRDFPCPSSNLCIHSFLYGD